MTKASYPAEIALTPSLDVFAVLLPEFLTFYFVSCTLRTAAMNFRWELVMFIAYGDSLPTAGHRVKHVTYMSYTSSMKVRISGKLFIHFDNER